MLSKIGILNLQGCKYKSQNYEITRDRSTGQIHIKHNDIYDDVFKIHLNIKLEYLFWAISTIFENIDRILPLICHFKFNTNFQIYTVLNKLYLLSNPEGHAPLIIFYPHSDTVGALIQILLELFPDNLNISSGLFPRYNFRINDSLYFSIGDSIQKTKNPELYKIPDEYIRLQDNCDRIDDIALCKQQNIITKKIINYNLCKVSEENKCKKANIKSSRLLLLKDIAFTVEDIYRILGIGHIYDTFNQQY